MEHVFNERGRRGARLRRAWHDGNVPHVKRAHIRVWLYELQQASRRDARRAGPAVAAVDELLAMDW